MLNVILTMVLISTSSAHLSYYVYAQNNVEKVTPYGEKCPVCGEYGYCIKPLTREEAMNSLKSHYGKKGFTVILLEPRHRFLEVGIYRNGTLVDRVLLDLKTGRMRSMY